MKRVVDHACQAAAQRELAAWQRAGEELVADRRVTRDELDRLILAWRVMVALFEGRLLHELTARLTFEDLETITRAALERRQDDVDTNQDPARHADLVARGRGVQAIYSHISILRALAEPKAA